MSRNAQRSSLGLRHSELLKGLSDARLEAIARLCAWRNFEPGQRIISREAENRDVYLLISGNIRITTYSAGGRQVTFRDLQAGEFFGELAAIDNIARSADAIALDNVLTASLPPAVFHKLVQDERLIAERVLYRLAAMVRQLTHRVIELSTLGVQNRIHAELLRLAREAGIKSNTARLNPAPKHADIASKVSTYREQVTRELSALKRQGLVRKEATALVIRDVAQLQKMVAEVRLQT